MAQEQKITITKNGPYLVQGGIPLFEDAMDADNEKHHMVYNRVKEFELNGPGYRLCRCGQSKHMPFCDNTHEHVDFDGTEVADRTPYRDRSDVYAGDGIYLLDDNRCAYARFCHRKDGDVWTLTEYSETDGIKKEAVEASWHCPTGRLTHYDTKSGEAHEESYDPSIIILQDIPEGTSGPIFVRGGVPLISEDGTEYETRNRYALCRCGHSQNKPFCDAYHNPYQFNDGSEAFKGKREGIDSSFEDPIPGAADAE